MAKRITTAALAQSTPATRAPVEMVPVTGLVRHPRNARSVPPNDSETAALRASVQQVGVLMPILLAQMDDGAWGVLAGWQRVSAAQAVRPDLEVPAIRVDVPAAELDRLSLMENTLRTEMHPLDTWRSVDTLLAGGATFKVAAATLGLDAREAQQMRLLAAIHPKVLEIMREEEELPGMWILRDIARADHDRQLEAMKAAWQGKGKSRTFHWQTMAAGCRMTRIPRAWAIFDVKTAGVDFERDFFAEPGSNEEWTTTNVEGFRAAQRAALDALVAGNAQAAVFDYHPGTWAPAVPREWLSIRWMDKIPKEVPALLPDQRFVVAVKPTGEPGAWIYRVPEQRAQENATRGGDNAPGAPAAPRLITDAGLQMAASMKATALREALENLHDYPTVDTIPVLLRALLECLAASNVVPGAADKYAAVEAIADATPDGGEPDPLRLVRIATEAIATMLIFPAPKIASSGPIADEIAHSLDAARFLPRCDTPDVLAQCTGALLRDAAALVELKPGEKVPKSVGALREWLAGRLPDWRPVSFDVKARNDG